MDNENLKLAFSRVKEDMIYLSEEIANLKYEITEIKTILNSLIDRQTDQQTNRQTYPQVNPTHTNIPTDTPTVPQEAGGLKTQKIDFSTGNEGVPTDTNSKGNHRRKSKKSKCYL